MAEKVTIEVEAKDKASDVLEGIGSAGLALGSIFATAVVAGIGAAVVALADFTSVAAEAEEVQTRFDTLVGNSNLAGFTDEMHNLADALSEVTRFDDETILSAEAMLSTFGTIGEDIFPEVTKTALDLAEALGTDATSAASTLGRAFADISGGSLTALRGVAKLTDAQKEAAEEMAKAGDVAGAQEFVLGVLGEKFGGLAEEMGNTFSGQWTIFQNRIDNMKEALGERLLPILTPLADMFGDLAEKALPILGQAIDQYVLPLIEALSAELSTFIASLDAGLSPIDAIKDALFNLTGLNLDEIFASLQPGLNAFGAFWAQHGPTMQKAIAETLVKLGEIGRDLAAQVVPWLVQKFNELGAWFVANGPLISEYVTTIGNAIVGLAGFVSSMWQIVKPILDGLISLLLDRIVLTMQIVTGDWDGAWQTMQNSLATFWKMVQGSFVGFANWIAGWFGTSWSRTVSVWSSNWTAFQRIVTTVWDMIKRGISEKWAEITGFVSDAINGLIDQFQNAMGAFVSLGADIVSSIQAGVENAWSSFVGWITERVAAIIGTILSSLGIGAAGAGIGATAVESASTVVNTSQTAPKSAASSPARGGAQRVNNNFFGPITLKLASDSEFLQVR